jgi:hypothetical protein
VDAWQRRAFEDAVRPVVCAEVDALAREMERYGGPPAVDVRLRVEALAARVASLEEAMAGELERLRRWEPAPSPRTVKALELRRSGASVAVIAAETGLSTGGVYKLLARQGEPTPARIVRSLDGRARRAAQRRELSG